MTRIAALTPTPGTLTVPATVSPRVTVSQPQAIIVPATIPFTPPPRSRGRRVPAAIAASIMFAGMGASFWFFTRDGKTEKLARRTSPAHRNTETDPDYLNLPAEHSPTPVTPTPAAAPRSGPEHTVATTEPREPVKLPDPPAPVVAVAPSPRSSYNPTVMGSEVGKDISPLDLVQTRVPFLRPLAEFDRDDVCREFGAELGRDPAFRIDVFTRNLPRSVEWFRAAAKSSGLNLYADRTTVERVNNHLVNSYVVYTEALTAVELADLFVRLNAEDAKISPRIFDVVHATTVVLDDQKAIKSILGVDPGLFKRPKTDKGIDSTKPLSAGTTDQIVKTITGKGSEKPAVLMTWLPAVAWTPPMLSEELKQFLLKRDDRKANAVPVLIVIRHRNG